MIKLIALDLDGTVITKDQKVSLNNRDAIKKCIDLGVMASIHTGRSAPEAIEIIRDLNLKGYHSASSGATLINENLQLINAKKMPGNFVRELIQVCRKLDIEFLGQTFDSCITYETWNNELDSVTDKIFVKHIADMTVDEVSQNMLQIVLFIKRDDPRNVYIQDRFSKHLKFRRAGELYVNIVDKSAGKLTGLKQIMELMGIKRQEVMAIGDTEVDLGIINYAGTGVAMGNSPEAVKLAADFVSTTCEEDGVSKAINKFIFNS